MNRRSPWRDFKWMPGWGIPDRSQFVMQKGIGVLNAKTIVFPLFALGLLSGCSRPTAEVDTVTETAPSPVVLQEMHDLLSERTGLQVKKRYFEQFTIDGPAAKESETFIELSGIENRLARIVTRLESIHQHELGPFERVAERAVLECHEEPLYGQSSYGIILYAVATHDIAAEELLLFHARGVYRTTGKFRALTTTGQGFYFRPNANIPRGERFVVACIQDAPEEIQNVKNGLMPDSDRARDPRRPYRTQVFGSDDRPIPAPNQADSPHDMRGTQAAVGGLASVVDQPPRPGDRCRWVQRHLSGASCQPNSWLALEFKQAESPTEFSVPAAPRLVP